MQYNTVRIYCIVICNSNTTQVIDMIKSIIVEGPDCSGKSTVVDRIKNMLRWDSKSLHHREGNQFNRYLKEYAFGCKTVFDRSHISEIVYSILWRGGNPFNEREESILNEIVREKSLIIFVCPELEVIQKRYLNRDFDQQIKLDELEKSRKIFIEIMDKFAFIFYQSKDNDELDNLLKKIKGLIS